MKSLGEQIGRSLRGGEVLQLVGDIGAGKTTLVKGIARGLGIVDDVQSPSFTISRLYDARDELTLAHYDFYRLQDPGILRDELMEAENQKRTITVIEWADIVADVLPQTHATITISSPGETDRVVELQGVEIGELRV